MNSSAPMLRVRGLSRSFGGLRAVDRLDLEVGRGEIVGLLGPNGSGKTTAMNLISGALVPDAGVVEFDGEPVQGLPAFKLARKGMARAFQLVRVPCELSCLENVISGLAFGPRGIWGEAARTRARGHLARVGLADKADVPAGELTYIDQKRLELARALALQPKLLLLDEWLAGLNPTELQEGIALVREIRDSGLSILMVEHVMDAIRALCTRCVVMSAGWVIAQGQTAEVLAHPDVLAAYLGGAAHA
ncbi:MAG: ABC transporter ATP-binding protein [Rhodocyclaceae bacterium]|nr:MAG: ABC transporter ATP-binding protein [Rhodocyclaceae bacterium]